MRLHEVFPTISIEKLCGLFGFSRQSYYQYQETNYLLLIMQDQILAYVKLIRGKAPRMGCVKLFIKCQHKFCTDFTMGRDAFFHLLRENSLTLKRKKHRVITTDSNHPYPLYPNLIKSLHITCADQVWYSDITYIFTQNGPCYLSLITDGYCHLVVGWYLGETLEAKYVIKALEMAIADRHYPEMKTVHHSDRGSQYCSETYVAMLNKNHFTISMTEKGDPLENAVAERMNGILKQEWLYYTELKDIDDAREQIRNAIDFYNNERPHASINMMTPAEAQDYEGEIKRKWKNYYKKRNKESIVEE